MLLLRVKNWLEGHAGSVVDYDVYRRVQQINKEDLEHYANQKNIQSSELMRAAAQSGDGDERKFKQLALKAKEQEKEARLETKVRQRHLQAIVDVQAGRQE